MQLKHIIQAARLRTLPLSVAGIIVGCGLAGFKDGNTNNWLIFMLAVLTTIGFQVLSNFANDYGDGVKGTDNLRKGEKRLVASGDISILEMKRLIIITLIVTLITSVGLIYLAFGNKNWLYAIVFFALGIASVVAAIKYTVGKKAYGYTGLGDLFVFLFFGWLSVLGSYFLYQKQINFSLFLPASAIGLLSVAVLNLNNMRDQETDARANKNTLVVKIGYPRAKVYHYCLIIVALFFSLVFVVLHYQSPFQFVFLVAFVPLFLNIIKVYQNQEPSLLDSELKKVALSTFLFAILFTIFNQNTLI